MQAILFALISYLGWGSGDIFGTIASRKIGGYQVAFWLFLYLVPVYVLIAFIFPQGIQNLTIEVFVLNLVLGIIGVISMITFYESLRLGSSSLVATIAGAFPALVVPLSIIFLGEKISSPQLAAISIIIFGIIISTINFKELKSGKLELGKGILLAIITMILWGIYWTFIKIPVQQIGWVWPSLVGMLAIPIIPVFMKVRKMHLDIKSFVKVKIPLLLNALLIGLGSLSFNFAISIGGNVSIITPIAGSYPTLYAVLSYFVFKDPLKKSEILGIIVTLCGIVLLSIFSV